VGSLERRLVSWIDAGVLHLRDNRTARRRSWPLGDTEPRAADHTKYRVVAQAGERIYSAKIPRP
jgi:hypothetical protein